MTGRTVPLKHAALLNPEVLPEDTPESMKIEYIDIGSVEHGDLVEQPARLNFGNAPSRARRVVRSGDTIISTVRTYLRAVLAIDDTMDGFIASTGFLVVRPENVEARFMSWSLQSTPFVDEVVARSVGVSYPAISPSAIGRISIAVPDSQTQHRIADFLDRETERIDALVDKKRRLIDLLEEKRTATITQAVTKGLDPAVPMKSSGIPWIGDVPEHWEVIPLRRILKSISDGPFGSALTSSHYSDTGPRVVRLGNIGDGVFENTDRAHISPEYFEELNSFALKDGDLVMAGLGDDRRGLGRTVTIPPDILPAIVKADCFRVRICPTLADSTYVATFLSSSAGTSGAVSFSRGTTRQRINTTMARDLPVPLPPPEEQVAIASHARAIRDTASRTTVAVNAQLSLLAEYREALITAAVTGEIDVDEFDADRQTARTS